MIRIVPIALRRSAQVDYCNARTEASVADLSAMTMVCQTRHYDSSIAADCEGRKTCTVYDKSTSRRTEMKKVVSVRPTRAMASYQAVPAVWIASR
jgi:hypothetical protein